MTSKGTAIRNVRIADSLWFAAKAKAESDGVSVSDVVRAALEAYVRHD